MQNPVQAIQERCLSIFSRVVYFLVPEPVELDELIAKLIDDGLRSTLISLTCLTCYFYHGILVKFEVHLLSCTEERYVFASCIFKPSQRF